MRIAVLGCGPAGLMAAQGSLDALRQNWGRVEAGSGIGIFSIANKSSIYGCQYLHKPIPHITPSGPRRVSYTMRGASGDYRRKVYGQMWSGTVSPEDLEGEHMAWDLREAYDILWDRWADEINNVVVDPVWLNEGLPESEPDLIINSIPRPELCYRGHPFGATEIWAAGDAPDLGIRLPFQCPEDMVICNAEENPAWYRMSRVFGHTTVEWPGWLERVPVTTAARVRKPTAHPCDCWPDVHGAPIMHVGRYGRWEKGVLSHDAYFDAFKKVDEMIGGRTVAADQEGS